MEKIKNRKVLIIEDDEDVITYLSMWLSDQGFEVEVARNGVEATDKIKAKKPDLITLDIVMPEKTGVRFYREIRKDPEYAKIPVIIITGLENEFQSFISHRRTAPPPEGYIQKPFTQDDLIAEITKVVGNIRQAKSAK